MINKDLVKAINESQKIVIMGHIKGDGDSFGSAIGLKLGLEQLGKQAEIIAEDGLPGYLEFLYSYGNLSIKDEFIPGVELIIGLDWSDKKRAAVPDVLDKYLDFKTNVIIIDHHIRGSFADEVMYSWVDDTKCATAEMILELLSELGVKLDKNIATSLMTGIETDTSSFQNQNTTSSCMLASSKLIKAGARIQNIKRGITADKSVEVMKLWGLAMSRLRFNEKYKIAITYLSYKDAEKLGISISNSSGIINSLNSIRGAKMVALITEEEPESIKVSLRTREESVDVSRLARFLGGGGHVKAAGFTFPGTLELTSGAVRVV